MPHRLMQAIWQAQQALQQVQLMAEQLMREQEIRNAWYNQQSKYQPNYSPYQMSYLAQAPIQYQGMYPPPKEAVFQANMQGRYIEPVFEENLIDVHSMNQVMQQVTEESSPTTSPKVKSNRRNKQQE